MIKNVCFQRRYLPVINLHEAARLEHLAKTLSILEAFRSAFSFFLMVLIRLKVFFDFTVGEKSLYQSNTL